jgi:DNA-binding LytR/AlgR family response regulator
MKVKIYCQTNKRDTIEAMLRNGGFEISEQGEYEFIETNFYFQTLIGIDNEKNHCFIALSDILYIDSSGRDIVIHTEEGIFRINETLENLERKLPPNDFSRISKSTIIRRTAIKKISPSFQMRLKVTMKNNDSVYVTRTYYYNFINFMNL